MTEQEVIAYIDMVLGVLTHEQRFNATKEAQVVLSRDGLYPSVKAILKAKTEQIATLMETNSELQREVELLKETVNSLNAGFKALQQS